MKNEISKFVGGRIRDIRKKRNLTQKELGEKIGVKHNTISSYENGTNEPEHDILFKIAKVLNVSINDFFPSGDNEYKESFIYNYYPTEISAGLPDCVDGITENDVKKITVPDRMMGKFAGHKDIFFTRINGDSMNKVIPDGSLIAVKPVEFDNLKNGDIVIYKHDGEYAVKRFYKDGDSIIFRPDSNDVRFTDLVINLEAYLTYFVDTEIIGKVVLYIVELD